MDNIAVKIRHNGKDEFDGIVVGWCSGPHGDARAIVLVERQFREYPIRELEFKRWAAEGRWR